MSDADLYRAAAVLTRPAVEPSLTRRGKTAFITVLGVAANRRGEITPPRLQSLLVDLRAS